MRARPHLQAYQTNVFFHLAPGNGMKEVLALAVEEAAAYRAQFSKSDLNFHMSST